MYERTGEGETTKPGGRAIVPFIARRRPVMEWHEWHGKRESDTKSPEPCGEKPSDQTNGDAFGLDHRLVHLGEERDRCI